MTLTKTQQWVLDYLTLYPGDWVSPTEIGRMYGRQKHNTGDPGTYNSAFASPRCLALTRMGLIQRSDKGWYRVS